MITNKQFHNRYQNTLIIKVGFSYINEESNTIVYFLKLSCFVNFQMGFQMYVEMKSLYCTDVLTLGAWLAHAK